MRWCGWGALAHLRRPLYEVVVHVRARDSHPRASHLCVFIFYRMFASCPPVLSVELARGRTRVDCSCQRVNDGATHGTTHDCERLRTYVRKQLELALTSSSAHWRTIICTLRTLILHVARTIANKRPYSVVWLCAQVFRERACAVQASTRLRSVAACVHIIVRLRVVTSYTCQKYTYIHLYRKTATVDSNTKQGRRKEWFSKRTKGARFTCTAFLYMCTCVHCIFDALISLRVYSTHIRSVMIRLAAARMVHAV